MTPLLIRLSRNHMATTFDLEVSCAPDRRRAAEYVLGEVHQEIARVESELSEFLEDGPVARLNLAPPGREVPVPRSVMELVERSHSLSRATRLAFDVTAKSAGPRPRLGWDAERGVIWRSHEGARLGFGAIGKGYALDRARLFLEREGFNDYCLSAGGSSILISGFASAGQPWRWGWSWRYDESGTPWGLELSHPSGLPVALGISGLHEKGPHLIDFEGKRPSTGRSALAAHPSATDADALSTALFVGGWDAWPDWDLAAAGAETPALAIIDEKGVARWNGVFQKLWGTLAAVSALFLFTGKAIADESIDLTILGMDDFTPYTVERNSLWILLPFLSLLLVVWHLKKPKRSRPRPKPPTL